MSSSSSTAANSRHKKIIRRLSFIALTLGAIGVLMCLIFFELTTPRRITIPDTQTVNEQALMLTLQASAPQLPPSDATSPATNLATSEPTPTPTRINITLTPIAPTATPTPTTRPTPRPPAADIPWPQTLNIVLLGSDKRPTDRTWRTDTMIIVAIAPDTKQVGVIPVPRDLWIELPRYANRINTLDYVGGPELVKQGLQWQLGIPIHYYARMNFAGFVKTVDTLGGITVDVECGIHETGGELGTVDIPSGPVPMNGQLALTFARSRLTTTDFDRMRRQQAVLLAFRKKLLTPEMLPRLPELVTTLSQMTETDIPLPTLLSLARLGVELDLKDVRGFLIDERVLRGVTVEGQGSVQQMNDEAVKTGLQNLWNGQPLTEAIKRPKTWACR
jgi:LCP family protein required for cell wall assembly